MTYRPRLSLEEARARLRACTYPGPECLEPYEVEDYIAGKLSPERMAHLPTCPECAAMAETARYCEHNKPPKDDTMNNWNPDPLKSYSDETPFEDAMIAIGLLIAFVIAILVAHNC